jgi:hypothetical protein
MRISQATAERAAAWTAFTRGCEELAVGARAAIHSVRPARVFIKESAMSATMLASFVVAASSAFTAPAPAPIVTHHVHAWVQLSAPAKLTSGRDTITVGRNAGRFDKLELVAAKGDTYISKLAIKFADGQRETITLDRAIDKRTQPTLTVELAGHDRAIASIVVYGNGGARSAYDVLAI